MSRETPAEKLLRMTQLERALTDEGILHIAGMDEVGRGPLAGPVVTACVALPMDPLIPGVDDSKKLSEKKREALFTEIDALACYKKTGWMSAQAIDEMNILNATKRAMEIAAMDYPGGFFLIDAVTGLTLPGETRSLIHGDAQSYLIAAASIYAKVTRDRYMVELDAKYPQYGFCRNKGYGTAEHIEALRKYGPCPEHRRTFISHFCPEDR